MLICFSFETDATFAEFIIHASFLASAGKLYLLTQAVVSLSLINGQAIFQVNDNESHNSDILMKITLKTRLRCIIIHKCSHQQKVFF